MPSLKADGKRRKTMEIASALKWVCVFFASIYCGLADAFWLGPACRERLAGVVDEFRFVLSPPASKAQE